MEKSGFFNSNNSDRVYDATDFADYFGDLVSNGIFYRDSNNLKVTFNSEMTVAVQPGSAWINGYHYKNTSELELVLPTADGVNPRIDRIVVQWNNVNREILCTVKKGSPAALPVAPDLTRSSDIYELGIADIMVDRGALSISEDSINDTRLNPDLCGLINSYVTAVYE